MSPRLQNAGLALLLLVVAGLIASAVLGVVGKPGPAAVAARAPAGAIPEPPANRPRVEVLNASGRSGLAKEVTRYLRDRGFDVVGFGNAGPGMGTATRVVLRGTDSLAARRLAD
ncbi:MAG TPA: LytR C-terminal domain-containing protein, partial [Longimicrobiaceae bacterium]|nr:LytR C-terminal domain-containing protein [Longimicrobiaceae bacterium]